ncbi:MAG: response regulator [bacterium]|nr:response regulator [bacterium]
MTLVLGWGLVVALVENPQLQRVSVVSLVLTLLLGGLLKAGSVTIPRLALPIILFAAFCFISASESGVRGPSTAALPVVTAMSMLLLGSRAAMISTSLGAAATLAFAFGQTNGLIEDPLLGGGFEVSLYEHAIVLIVIHAVLLVALLLIRRHADADLDLIQQSDSRYRLLANNVHDFVWTTNLELNYEFVSPSSMSLLGYSPSEIVGTPALDSVMPQSAEVISKVFAEELRIEQEGGDLNRHRTMEIELKRRDGSSLWAESSISFLRDDNFAVVGLVGTTRDISDRKRAQKHEQELEKQLLQSQKLESLGTLAGGIAHDFNNVLQAILGFRQLASDNIHGDVETLSESLDEIERGGRRAADLVGQILTFSRRSTAAIEPLMLQPLIAGALQFIRSSIPATVRIESHIDPDCDQVAANPTQIHQLVTNLCTNAMHAMEEEGGVLSVSLTPRSIESPLETLSGRLEPGKYVELAIEDSGTGIEPAVLQLILDPFFSTKEVGKGTGLGLAMVHGIVSGMGGGLSVLSAVGSGTTVFVTLPALVESRVLEHPAKSAQPDAGGTGNIMVVDDEVAITKVTALLLERNGFTAEAFNDPDRALEVIRTSSKGYDLAILDYTMPRKTGLELAEHFHSLAPDMPVILVTGLLDMSELEEKKTPNVIAVMRKPFDVDALMETIRRSI